MTKRRSVSISIESVTKLKNWCSENNLKQAEVIDEIIAMTVNGKISTQQIVRGINVKRELSEKMKNISPERFAKIIQSLEAEEQS